MLLDIIRFNSIFWLPIVIIIQEFIKDEISNYFSARNIPSTVKYIDPSYMIRSVPANASDAMFCLILAQNAVHGAMAGFTAFSVGLVNNRVVYIPISRYVYMFECGNIHV